MFVCRVYDFFGEFRSYKSKNLLEVLLWLLRDAQLNPAERFKYCLYGGMPNG